MMAFYSSWGWSSLVWQIHTLVYIMFNKLIAICQERVGSLGMHGAAMTTGRQHNTAEPVYLAVETTIRTTVCFVHYFRVQVSSQQNLNSYFTLTSMQLASTKVLHSQCAPVLVVFFHIPLLKSSTAHQRFD